MKHLGAMILKFLMTLIVLAFILGYTLGWYYPAVLVISLIITIVGYIVGDLIILPRGGNIPATSADFGLILIIIWAVGILWFKEPVYSTGPLFSALILSVGEWFFHNYLKVRVFRIYGDSHA